MNKLPIFGALAGLVLIGVVFVFINGSDETAPPEEATATYTSADLSKVVVYKTASCGCCGSWVEHMSEAGFDVEVHDVSNEVLTDVKHDQGVHTDLRSCHTAVVDGYVVEGHVPADQVLRMLEERPSIAGLAVPGMPIGSPGMEVADKSQNQSYDVLAFQKSGDTSVFKHIEASE